MSTLKKSINLKLITNQLITNKIEIKITIDEKINSEKTNKKNLRQKKTKTSNICCYSIIT